MVVCQPAFCPRAVWEQALPIRFHWDHSAWHQSDRSAAIQPAELFCRPDRVLCCCLHNRQTLDGKAQNAGKVSGNCIVVYDLGIPLQAGSLLDSHAQLNKPQWKGMPNKSALDLRITPKQRIQGMNLNATLTQRPRNLQIMGFGFVFAIFLICGVAFQQLTANSSRLKWFQVHLVQSS